MSISDEAFRGARCDGGARYDGARYDGVRAHARRVTPIVLGAPHADRPSWLAFGFDDSARDVLTMDEDFARSTLPAVAVEAMRAAPCFYVVVDSLADAVARTPGRIVGGEQDVFGLRGLCVSTDVGMMVFVEA